MNYEATITPASELIDAGIAPADAVAVGALAHIGLGAVAAVCTAMSDRGASAEEIEAYRLEATADMASWVNRHLRGASKVIADVITSRQVSA